MCLRKSPIRTPALLAANRANALKSTGPRTPRGKRTSAWNALRHGYRSRAAWAAEPQDTRGAEALEAFRQALRVAIIPTGNEVGDRCVSEHALTMWKTKRVLDHWLERHPWPVFQPEHEVPPFLSLIINRPGQNSGTGWRIKVSVTVRWGRRPSWRRLRGLDPASAKASGLAWRTRRGRAHTVVSITCTDHPWTWSYRQRLPTNPECHRKGVAWENVIEDFETDGTGSSLGPRDFGIMPQSGRPPKSGLGTRCGSRQPAGSRRQDGALWTRGSGFASPTRLGKLKHIVLGWLKGLIGLAPGNAEPNIESRTPGPLTNKAGILQKTSVLQKCDDAEFASRGLGTRAQGSEIGAGNGEWANRA
jgi:hypothetical protein